MSTRAFGFTNTTEAGTRSAGSAPGYWAGSGAISAWVTWPVSSTNCRNSALVTGQRSIQNPPTVARCAGASSR